IIRQRETQLLRPVAVGDLVLDLAAHRVAAVALPDEPAQPQASLFPLRERADRRMTIARQRARERALGGGRERRAEVRERRERGDDIGTIGATFEGERALPGRRQTLVGLEQRADAIAVTEALQSRGREDDRVVPRFVELAQARVDVAAQRFDTELRKALAQ